MLETLLLGLGVVLGWVATPWVGVPLALLALRRLPPVRGWDVRIVGCVAFAVLVVVMLSPRDAATGQVLPNETLTALTVLAMAVGFMSHLANYPFGTDPKKR